jgi:hypothetical protein
VSFLRDGDRKIIVDPGFVPSQRAILDPLAELGYEAGDITDVIFSHWHPDHTYNAGLFPNAQAHDVWGVYRNDTWLFRYAEGYQVSPGVTLIQTPGHTDQDITTLAATDQGLGRVSQCPQPGEDCGEDDSASVGESELVVAGGQATPLLEGVEGSFDDVAALVGVGVEGGWSAAAGPASGAGGLLVVGLGDHRGDAAGARRCAVAARGVRLVRDHLLRAGARAARPSAGNLQDSSSGRNIGESPPWPGPSSRTSGRPRPSQRWWIFVDSPPRERPMAWSGGSTRRFV